MSTGPSGARGMERPPLDMEHVSTQATDMVNDHVAQCFRYAELGDTKGSAWLVLVSRV
jgi:hypothetical protein